MINKRYKDIFNQYIYKGEQTPLTIGTLVVCALCFLFLIIATFTQLTIVHPWLKIVPDKGISLYSKTILYTPQIPIMLFIIYILGKYYSLIMFALYLMVGFFIWPIFVFGGGLEYIQNYLFGYFIGFVAAIFIAGTIMQLNNSLKTRLIAGFLGVLSIHICGFIYCLILAMFKVIDFNLILPIVNIVTVNKIIYDIIFSLAILSIAPYIKNILWICMKPKPDSRKKLKNSRKRNQIIRDNINQHRQDYD